MYKINSNLIHIPCDELIHNPRKNDKFLIPSSSVDAHLFSFYPSTIRLWNSAPQDLKSSTSLASFKSSLEKITISHPLGD